MAPAMEPDSSSSSSRLFLLYCATTIALIVFLSLLLKNHRNRNNGRRRRLPPPPGPPAVVFLAKFLALRRSIFDLAPLLRYLHARYGPIISIRLLARTLVFVSDRRLAHKILVQSGATFADRPPPADPVSALFSAGGRDVGTSPYGSYWRLLRRNLAAEALHPARVALFAHARRLTCDRLVERLLTSSAGGDGGTVVVVVLRPLLRRAMFELLVYMCFGTRLDQDVLDEIEGLQQRALRSLTSFPVFAFFPAVTRRLFRRRWDGYVTVRRRQEEVFVPLIHSGDRGGGDGGPPCYADSLRKLKVTEEGERALTDGEMVSLCSEFLNGGTDTTVTLVEWIMAELVNHPDVQTKLRDEVRRKTIMPDGDDLQEQPAMAMAMEMPYLKAVVMEGLRLHPPGHFVLPHGVRKADDGAAAVDVDIGGGGYAVPTRGAEVNFMVAEMGRDETVWTAAMEFRPERFVDGGEGCGVDITGSREIKMMPFGAGRRMCPGYALGMHHAEYFVARMVRDLEWLPPAEDDGAAVDMAEVLDFTVVMKQPLRARVVVARH